MKLCTYQKVDSAVKSVSSRTASERDVVRCCRRSVKNRVPSWCDRILWHVHKDAYSGVELDVELDQYTSIDEFVDSDHKPVIADCSVLASAPVDMYSSCVL